MAVETRGAKPIFHDKRKVAEKLIGIQNGSETLTNYMLHRMSQEGFINIVQHESDGKPGRPGSHIELTKKAKSIISLSKAWDKNRRK